MIRETLKSLFFGAAIALASPASALEQWTLETHGAWEVQYIEWSDGARSCAVTDTWIDNEGYTHHISFNVFDGGGNLLTISSDLWEPVGQEIQSLYIGFDWAEHWTLSPTTSSYAGGGAWLAIFSFSEEGQTSLFFDHFMKYRQMFVLDHNDERLFGFSLTGSAAAMQGMLRCLDRIGEPA